MCDSVKNSVKRLIISKGCGVYWFADDFLSCGSNESVRKALQQLSKDDVLLRIAHGVYHFFLRIPYFIRNFAANYEFGLFWTNAMIVDA